MKMPLSDICYCGDKGRGRLQDDFEAVDAALKKKYRAVYDVHYFLERNGLRDALRGNKPTRTRGARQIIDPTISMFRALALGDQPLMKSFRVVTVFRGKVYGNPESLTLLQGWDDAWAEKADLEKSIGYKISDLEMATVDASDLVTVAGARPWESRTVPKKRTTENKHGEPVLKRLRDEGKKPATCPCGNTFVSAAKLRPENPGIKCVGKKGCGKFIAQYD